MNYWFITLLILSFMDLALAISRHGKPREGKYSIGDTFIIKAILMFLIYKAVQTGF